MDLTWVPAWELREMIVRGDVSPVEVTEHFLGRAEELDPLLHCFRTLDPVGARRQAVASEKAVLGGGELGLLHGIPVSVKEHVTVEGMPFFPLGIPSEPGSAFPIATRDAPVVRRLRDAGAVVFGTNIMPGMGSMGLADAAGAPTTDLSFHSRNPWDLDRVPGSSSAGGCAAVSGGVIPLAFGSDGGGSTRLPAAWSGLLGLHPTLGRVPMGEPPGSSWNTSLGPLTRDARSGALALQAVAGPEGGELFSLQTDAPDYLAGLDAGVEGLRVAWTDDYGFARTYAGEESERVIAEVRSAAAGLVELGASVVPTDEVFPEWKPMLGLAPQGVVRSHDAFLAGQDCRRAWWDGLRRVFAGHDVLATTTIQHVAFPVERWNEAWNADMLTFSLQWCAHTFPQNFLGWPALAVPCGLVDGLPVSLHLTAPPDGEGLLYRVAAAVLASRPLGLPAGLTRL